MPSESADCIAVSGGKTSKSFSRGEACLSARDVVEGVPKRILVVEDDPLIIETIVRSLEEEPYDYEIVSAADGIEAGSQVSNFSPDLLILDIMMPNIDGHEVCRQVKQDPSTSHMKVMVPLRVLGRRELRKNEAKRRRRLLLQASSIGNAQKGSGSSAGNGIGQGAG